METKNIVTFLQTQYSDEKLAALLAHAEDDKLSFLSCCCFIGVATADHALRESFIKTPHTPTSEQHYVAAQRLPSARLAEREFNKLGCCELPLDSDKERRRFIIPLIHAEMARRDALREIADAVRLPEVSGNELSGERTQNTLSSDRQLSHK